MQPSCSAAVSDCRALACASRDLFTISRRRRRHERRDQLAGRGGHLIHRVIERGFVRFRRLLNPLTFRTNCSAEARTSSSVAGGSKLNNGLMFRHISVTPRGFAPRTPLHARSRGPASPTPLAWAHSRARSPSGPDSVEPVLVCSFQFQNLVCGRSPLFFATYVFRARATRSGFFSFTSSLWRLAIDDSAARMRARTDDAARRRSA